MQHDEMIWQFCSFKTTIGKAHSDKVQFCRNPYSVTGLCNRTSCPLANSKYATIREDNGRIYLYVKTVERAHSPKNLWEKIQLSRNYGKAIQQLDEHLAYFPKVLIHRNKQRLTKIYQYLLRMRKIELKQRSGKVAKLVSVHRKIDQREERRERKALIAAKIERHIEKELIERLAKGTYGDIYNFPEMPYQKALDAVEEKETQDESTTEAEAISDDDENEMESTSMVEYVEDFDSEEEDEDVEDMEYIGNGEWGSAQDNNDDDDEEDDESSNDDDDDNDDHATKKKKAVPRNSNQQRGQRPRIEIEYEEEHEDGRMAQKMATK